MQGISHDRRGDPRGLEIVDGAESIVFDLTPAGLHRGKLLAGPAPLPKGAVILGHVGGCRDGALMRLANGVYVDYGAGCIRSLDQRAVIMAVEGTGGATSPAKGRNVVSVRRGPRAAVEASRAPARMGEGTFRRYMGACRALCSGDYRRGYEYGLRRHYHGERFGDTSIIEKMLARGGDLAAGTGDGLSGRGPRDAADTGADE